MKVTRSTTVREIVDSDRRVLEVFEQHSVCVEDECPDGVLDFELEDCEAMCHIDDVDQLVSDLNGFFREQKQ